MRSSMGEIDPDSVDDGCLKMYGIVILGTDASGACPRYGLESVRSRDRRNPANRAPH
jgi:hypothetical protein